MHHPASHPHLTRSSHPHASAAQHPTTNQPASAQGNIKATQRLRPLLLWQHQRCRHTSNAPQTGRPARPSTRTMPQPSRSSRCKRQTATSPRQPTGSMRPAPGATQAHDQKTQEVGRVSRTSHAAIAHPACAAATAQATSPQQQPESAAMPSVTDSSILLQQRNTAPFPEQQRLLRHKKAEDQIKTSHGCVCSTPHKPPTHPPAPQNPKPTHPPANNSTAQTHRPPPPPQLHFSTRRATNLQLQHCSKQPLQCPQTSCTPTRHKRDKAPPLSSTHHAPTHSETGTGCRSTPAPSSHACSHTPCDKAEQQCTPSAAVHACQRSTQRVPTRRQLTQLRHLTRPSSSNRLAAGPLHAD
jgi:hypothetical protein